MDASKGPLSWSLFSGEGFYGYENGSTRNFALHGIRQYDTGVANPAMYMYDTGHDYRCHYGRCFQGALHRLNIRHRVYGNARNCWTASKLLQLTRNSNIY